jgi:hypothetical protein
MDHAISQWWEYGQDPTGESGIILSVRSDPVFFSYSSEPVQVHISVAHDRIFPPPSDYERTHKTDTCIIYARRVVEHRPKTIFCGSLHYQEMSTMREGIEISNR